MHAVARYYSGSGASELFDVIEANKAEIESLLRNVSGVVAYTLFRIPGGGVSITVCQDKAGTDESVAVARKWVAEKAAHTGASAPNVSEGEVILHLT